MRVISAYLLVRTHAFEWEKISCTPLDELLHGILVREEALRTPLCIVCCVRHLLTYSGHVCRQFLGETLLLPKATSRRFWTQVCEASYGWPIITTRNLSQAWRLLARHHNCDEHECCCHTFPPCRCLADAVQAAFSMSQGLPTASLKRSDSTRDGGPGP